MTTIQKSHKPEIQGWVLSRVLESGQWKEKGGGGGGQWDWISPGKKCLMEEFERFYRGKWEP